MRLPQGVRRLLEHLLPLVLSGDLELTTGSKESFAEDRVAYEVHAPHPTEDPETALLDNGWSRLPP